jgi:hypothetical protein
VILGGGGGLFRSVESMWASRSKPERRGERLMCPEIGAGAGCSCESREIVLRCPGPRHPPLPIRPRVTK